MVRMTGLLFAAFVILSAALVFLSRLSSPRWLVYAADRDNGIADIFILDTARRMMINLTETPETGEDTPSVSADGTQIAFSRTIPGAMQICVQTLGAGERCFEPAGRWDSDPHWSPDGAQIVFTTPGQTNLAELVLLKPESGEEIRLAVGQDNTTNPDWSPDGERIAAVNASPLGSHIIVIQVPDGQITHLNEGVSGQHVFPVWSPDGRQIAYLHDGFRLALMNADGTDTRFLTGEDEHAYFPSWSPDGRQIVFQANPGGTDWELYIFDLASGDVRAITDNRALDERPAWSPDGRQIAFRSDRNGDINLYLYDVAAGTTRQVTDGLWFYHPPVWPGQGSHY